MVLTFAVSCMRRRVGRRNVGLFLLVAAVMLVGCHGRTAMLSPTAAAPPVDVIPATPSVVSQVTAIWEVESEVTPTPTVTLLPTVPGLTDAQVASLASLRQVDDYPLYVMHIYGDAATGAAAPPADANAAPSFACSLFAAFGDTETRLYGRNFDWDYSPALLLYAHPVAGYDSVSMVDLGFYFSEAEARNLAAMSLPDRLHMLDLVWRHPFDGMNDQGLAIGMAAVPNSDLLHDPSLPTIGSLSIIREMLNHAADVDAALEIMRGYNIDMTGGPQIHYLISDAGGHAALVEYYEGEMVVIPHAEGRHLATNHFRAPLNAQVTFNCDRYTRMDEVLTATAGRLTPELAMDLLSDVAQSSTQWSVVYDSVHRKVHVAMGRDYGDVVVLEAEEWAK